MTRGIDVTVSQERSHSPQVDGHEPGGAACARLAWLGFTIGALALVVHHGSSIPVWDDYAIVPAALGEQAVTPAWLWSLHNEHRIPLPRLIFLGLSKLGGFEPRAGMLLSVVALSVLAAALIRLTRTLPRGTLATDAIFPLLLLHAGHAANLLWYFQLHQILPTALGASFLYLIASRAGWPGPGSRVLWGLLLALPPLCGATGLVYVPPLAGWLILGSFSKEAGSNTDPGWLGRQLRSPGMTALALMPAVAITILYFRGFQGTPHPPAPGGMADAGRAAVQFLTGGVGLPASWAWPWSGVVTLAVMGLATVFLVRAWLFDEDERPRVLGLVAFLGALLLMAAGVGWGRGWAGPLAGFQDRYVTMAAPFWCWVVVVFRLYPPRWLSTALCTALIATACLLLWPNTQLGLEHGRKIAGTSEALTRDVLAGVPPFRLAREYTPFLHPSQDEVARLLPMLKEGKVAPFDRLVDNPAFTATPLPRKPTGLTLATWDDATGTVHVTGVDPQIVYKLPIPRPVAGIRLRYSHSNPQHAPARFQLTWRRPGQSTYNDHQRYANWALPTGPHHETTLWVDDLVSEFRIQPDNQPCDFQVEEIAILQP